MSMPELQARRGLRVPYSRKMRAVLRYRHPVPVAAARERRQDVPPVPGRADPRARPFPGEGRRRADGDDRLDLPDPPPREDARGRSGSRPIRRDRFPRRADRGLRRRVAHQGDVPLTVGRTSEDARKASRVLPSTCVSTSTRASASSRRSSSATGRSAARGGRAERGPQTGDRVELPPLLELLSDHVEHMPFLLGTRPRLRRLRRLRTAEQLRSSIRRRRRGRRRTARDLVDQPHGRSVVGRARRRPPAGSARDALRARRPRARSWPRSAVYRRSCSSPTRRRSRLARGGRVHRSTVRSGAAAVPVPGRSACAGCASRATGCRRGPRGVDGVLAGTGCEALFA